MKDNYSTNSPFLTYTFLFKRSGECINCELRVKGLTHTYESKNEAQTNIDSLILCLKHNVRIVINIITRY